MKTTNIKNNNKNDVNNFPKRKVLFSKHWPSFVDQIITRDISKKRFDKIQKMDDTKKKIFIEYNVNKLAKSLHPKYIDLVIDNIIEHNKDTKTYILKSANTEKNEIPVFRAGQYLSITDSINNFPITRPYSISSSPNDALEKNFYAITLKRKPNGFFSNYALDNWKIKKQLISTDPQGDFYYESLRDGKNILAIAGGSGITPFISMAKAIIEKTENFNLTILFGNRKKQDIFCLKELEYYEKMGMGKVKVINVLSEEKTSNFEYGFINLNIINKYMQKNSVIYLCGPKNMYKFIAKELEPLNLERKMLRVEASNEIGRPSNYLEYKNIGNKKIYKMIVNSFGTKKEINIDSEDTILVALQKAKISTPSNCLSGLCSWCRVKVINGQIFTPKGFAHQRLADNDNKIYYSCSTFAVTDLEIEAY